MSVINQLCSVLVYYMKVHVLQLKGAVSRTAVCTSPKLLSDMLTYHCLNTLYCFFLEDSNTLLAILYFLLKLFVCIYAHGPKGLLLCQ